MSNFSKTSKLLRHWVWVAPIVLGVAFIVGGGYMMVEGRNARNDVRDSVVQEDITVSAGAPFEGETIDSAAKADAQSAAILEHTLADTGGYLYAQLGRFALPTGTFALPRGTFLTEAGDTTTDESLAALDESGSPIIMTTDESLAAKNRNDQPVAGWTSDAKLAAMDANGNPVPNPLRTTALTSANLRTSLGVATMGFKVADLVVGLGLFLGVLGLMNVFIISPVTYWATVVADEHERSRQTASTKETAQGRQPA